MGARALAARPRLLRHVSAGPEPANAMRAGGGGAGRKRAGASRSVELREDRRRTRPGRGRWGLWEDGGLSGIRPPCFPLPVLQGLGPGSASNHGNSRQKARALAWRVLQPCSARKKNSQVRVAVTVLKRSCAQIRWCTLSPLLSLPRRVRAYGITFR
ncbi:hypothetical protein NDU88_006040 [Pleurodeles waltl]|uniref:Uncharacterized protein n=1 Tax=Pleurodeles waltl TaxID=8319 RepID=A0AAV7L2N3_PLEWA|nr:hypothetical protein NDU88_006040 [Pleurodeles waltl]